MIAASEIKHKIRLLGEAGLQPYCVHIGYFNKSWRLGIITAAWIDFDMPKSELLSLYQEIKISEGADVKNYTVENLKPVTKFKGVKISGGQKAPDLCIDLPGNAAASEQYEALYNDCQEGFNVYSTDWSALQKNHQWYRFCFSDWHTEEWHQKRKIAQALKERNRDHKKRIIEVSENICFEGRTMIVKRPCGCETRHYQTPRHGRMDRPSLKKFGEWLAKTPCLKCT